MRLEKENHAVKIWVNVLLFLINLFDFLITGWASIISFTSTIGAPVRIESASFTLIFPITTGIVKKLLNITGKKKKKHDQILMLAKSKFNSIETLISQGLNDMEISHEEFLTICKEKGRYEKIKEDIRDKNEHKEQEIIKLSNIK